MANIALRSALDQAASTRDSEISATELLDIVLERCEPGYG